MSIESLFLIQKEGRPPKPTENHLNPLKTTETHRKPPKTTGTHRKPPKTIENHQKPLKPTENHRNPPEANSFHFAAFAVAARSRKELQRRHGPLRDLMGGVARPVVLLVGFRSSFWVCHLGSVFFLFFVLFGFCSLSVWVCFSIWEPWGENKRFKRPSGRPWREALAQAEFSLVWLNGTTAAGLKGGID